MSGDSQIQRGVDPALGETCAKIATPRRKLSFLEITLRLTPMYAMFALTGFYGFAQGDTKLVPWVMLGEMMLGGLTILIILAHERKRP